VADHTLPTRPQPVWQKMVQSPLTQHTTCGQRGGRPKFNYGQTVAEKKTYPNSMIEGDRFTRITCATPPHGVMR